MQLRWRLLLSSIEWNGINFCTQKGKKELTSNMWFSQLNLNKVPVFNSDVIFSPSFKRMDNHEVSTHVAHQVYLVVSKCDFFFFGEDDFF